MKMKKEQEQDEYFGRNDSCYINKKRKKVRIKEDKEKIID